MKGKEFPRFRPATPDEQEVLIHLLVEPVPPAPVERFDQRIAQHHCLKRAQVVGEPLRYVAPIRASGWRWPPEAPPRPRPVHRLEWEPRRTRLPLVVNNSRLLVLPACQCPNLISRFMHFLEITKMKRFVPVPSRWLGFFLSLPESLCYPEQACSSEV